VWRNEKAEKDHKRERLRALRRLKLTGVFRESQNKSMVICSCCSGKTLQPISQHAELCAAPVTSLYPLTMPRRFYHVTSLIFWTHISAQCMIIISERRWNWFFLMTQGIAITVILVEQYFLHASNLQSHLGWARAALKQKSQLPMTVGYPMCGDFSHQLISGDSKPSEANSRQNAGVGTTAWKAFSGVTRRR
jgi:hypothetical protein